MNLLQLVTDRYDRQARFVPAVLVLAPVLVLAGTAIPAAVDTLAKVVAIATLCLPPLLSQTVRDRGIRVEDDLFRSWGGRPSEKLLRWRESPTRTEVERRHRLVAAHLGIVLPDAAAETADPGEADAAYQVVSAALRERTREQARFPLVFDELITYGFRRNGYACRVPAMILCAATAVITLALAYWAVVPLGWKQQSALIGFDTVAALVWWRWFSAPPVRRAAEKYAAQLYASLETLAAEPSPAQSSPAQPAPEPE